MATANGKPFAVLSWIVTFGAVALLAAIIAVIMNLMHKPLVLIPPAERCRAVAGASSATLTLEQSENATIIVGESIRRGLPARAATIALATALQESGLRNLDYGDRDSIGLFQQRPSQGWGDVAQIMDPWYSAGKFYEALVKVPDWSTGDINDVAQTVQRSGFPDAYRQHEQTARTWASALAGYSTTALSCIDRTSTVGDNTALESYLTKVWGRKVRVSTQARVVTVNVPDATTGWAVAQLAMSGTLHFGIAGVQVGGQTWNHNPDAYAGWQPTPTPMPTPTSGTVQLVLKG